ncbi:MAG: PKD domain-containing protein [Candidatus Gracilibacteria bacterium]
MDIKKPTSVTQKISLLQKIIAFARNDADYQPEQEKTPIHISVGSTKVRSGWKNLKAAVFVLMTFYILLCAFILLNPQFALFFNNIFAIEYVTIQRILEYTIYVFYSIFGIILGTAFLFFWYRAIVIKTHKKLKHFFLWFLTVFFGGLFFGNIALFAISYNWFLNIDFSNLEERVIIYDNTLFGYKSKMKDKDLTFFKAPKKGIGPISVRYDISPQIKKAIRTNGLLLSRGYSFSIDYNKDGEPDIGSGENTKIDLPITHPDAPLLVPGEFEEVGQYKTTATLYATDAGGNKKEITIEIPDILIQNMVKVSYRDRKDGSKIYLFDASDLSSLGQAQWTIIGSTTPEINGYQFSPENITQYPAIICLKMQPMDVTSTDPCDWRYVIGESIQTNITNTDIQIKIDPINPLKYQFTIDPKLAQGQVKSIRWRIDGSIYDGVFSSGTEKILDYTFKKSGTYSIEAEIEDTLGNKVNVTKETIFTTLFTTLKNGYTLQIVDENGLDVAKNTYDDALRAYLLPDMATPSVLTFDAIGIQSTNSRLKLVQAEWDMDNDGLYEKKGFQTSYDLQLPIQYTFNARYTFEDTTIDGEIQKQIYVDKIIVKGEQKSLDVRVKIRLDHEYAPALVHFDATGSRAQKGVIQKFFYEFGDGKTYEGEGIVDYRYVMPGDYKVRVTAVTNLGEKAVKEYILIIKKPQETIKIEPSISAQNSAVDTPITFVALTQGAVKNILWNFGDNIPSPDGESVIHTFRTPGVYHITARALYESGIEKTETIIYTIQ